MIDSKVKEVFIDEEARVIVSHLLNTNHSIELYGNRPLWGGFKVPGMTNKGIKDYVENSPLKKIIRSSPAAYGDTEYEFRFDQETGGEKREELSIFLLEEYPGERYIQMLKCFSFFTMDEGTDDETIMPFNSYTHDFSAKNNWGEVRESISYSEFEKFEPFTLLSETEQAGKYFLAAQGFRLNALGIQYQIGDKVRTKIYTPLHVDNNQIQLTPQLEELSEVEMTGLHYRLPLHIIGQQFPINFRDRLPEKDIVYKFRVDDCPITQFPLAVSQAEFELVTK